jgi:hypothetical protein
MADSVVAVTLRSPGVSSEGRFFVAEFNVVPSAGDYVSGGLTVDFTTPGMAGLGTPTVTFSSPMVTGFYVEYVPSTTMANGKFRVYDVNMVQHTVAPLAGTVATTSFRATVRIPKFKR